MATKWTRPNVPKKLYDKVHAHSVKENDIPANRLIEKWLQNYIDKYDL